jgi:hypothetical protein
MPSRHRFRVRKLVAAPAVALALLTLPLASVSAAVPPPTTGTVVLSDAASTVTGAPSTADTVCPAGSVMTGIRVTTSHSPDTTHFDYPYLLVAQCTALQQNLGVVTATGPVSDGSVLQACDPATCGSLSFEGVGPRTQTATCPAAQVATSLVIVSGWWLDKMQLGCQALSGGGTPTGASTMTDWVGGDHNPAPPQPAVTCPTGTVAVGFQAQVGDNWVHYPRLECAAIIAGLYDFTGFFAPIRADGNTVKAGSAIPVQFSLAGDQGLNIFAPGSPTSVASTCGGAPDDAAVATVTAGGSSLSYDPASDTYTYVWKTDRAWSGTCRQLQVELADGVIHTADFSFR